MSAAQLVEGSSPHSAEGVPDPHASVEERLGDHEEVERLLGGLRGIEAQVVRMYHLEGKSYHEISAAVGMPENSIGRFSAERAIRCAARASIPPRP